MFALASCHGGAPRQASKPADGGSVGVSANHEPEYDEGNIEGTKFPNLKLVTNYGKKTTLRDEVSADYTLVVLYRPSDEGYRNMLNQLTLDRGIENAIIDKNLAIVVVNLESSLEELRLLSPTFPSIWRLTALTEDLGDVPTPFNPTMYLLDSKCSVVQQRPNIESVLKAVEKNNPQG